MNQSNMNQFVEVVRDELDKKLAEASLDLLDIGLIKDKPTTIVASVDEEWYILCGWVRHPLTKQVNTFRTKIGGVFGRTEADSVLPLVIDLTEKLIESFYGGVNGRA